MFGFACVAKRFQPTLEFTFINGFRFVFFDADLTLPPLDRTARTHRTSPAAQSHPLSVHEQLQQILASHSDDEDNTPDYDVDFPETESPAQPAQYANSTKSDEFYDIVRINLLHYDSESALVPAPGFDLVPVSEETPDQIKLRKALEKVRRLDAVLAEKQALEKKVEQLLCTNQDCLHAVFAFLHSGQAAANRCRGDIEQH